MGGDGAKSECGGRTGMPQANANAKVKDKRKGEKIRVRHELETEEAALLLSASIWVVGTYQVRDEDFRAYFERHVRVRDRRGRGSRESDDWCA